MGKGLSKMLGPIDVNWKMMGNFITIKNKKKPVPKWHRLLLDKKKANAGKHWL